ncbi:MAG: hypothetical protein K6B52_05865 [Clostridiales bacterium]|nr:hypothetical protein [Clostridiales bacterium]
MDPLDIVMKGIIKITRNYGKKVQKKEKEPVIEKNAPVLLQGGGYRVGFARKETMPNVKSGRTFYIAGHGSGHVMDGIISPVYVHSAWIDCGSDEGIIWLSVDSIGMTRIEINQIRRMIMDSPVIKGCKFIIVSCTHSHSGIDTLGYWGKPFLSIPADGKDKEYMDLLMENAVKASEEAYLNRKSGKLYYGNILIKDGLRTKRAFIDKHEYLSRFRFAPDDNSAETWFLNWGGHPNTLGGDNRKLSGEYPYFMREIISEKTGANVHFGIGAIGGMDCAELVENNPLECVKAQGKMVAEGAMSITDEIELEPKIKYLNQEFVYPVDNYVLTLLALRHTMSFKAYPCKESLTGISMVTEMTYMSIGDKKILFLPGESFMPTVYGPYMDAEHSTTGKGPEINPAPLAEIAGESDLIVYGETNDMTGYVVPPNDFVLNPTQPFLNGVHDRFDDNHYHETNSMGINSQKAIADAFAGVVERFD